MLLVTASLLFGGNCSAQAPVPSNQTMPLDQVQPGMQGYAYTIFAGDQVEKFDLEVIGVMPNFLGPKQSIILVQLKGPRVEHTGVVAGMSGSPVYIEGKLAGALSLKLGIFTKEPIAGVTPIADVLAGGGISGPIPGPTSGSISGGSIYGNSGAAASAQGPVSAGLAGEISQRMGLQGGAELRSIETPLVFSGFQTSAIQKFSSQLDGMGFVAAQGGTTPARPDDAKLAPGDMAGMVLVQGDVSINSACTVTAIQADKVFLCGHPFLNLGDVQLPMARSRVLTTLSSDLASTKIVNVGGPIGTITGDHLTAVTGKLGASPSNEGPCSGENRKHVCSRRFAKPGRHARGAEHNERGDAAFHESVRTGEDRRHFGARGKCAGTTIVFDRECMAGEGRSVAGRNIAAARSGATLPGRGTD